MLGSSLREERRPSEREKVPFKQVKSYYRLEQQPILIEVKKASTF
jgi:hypothetical protein